jgi:hypothetical protein
MTQTMAAGRATREAGMQAGLGMISLDNTGDGVAYVARLVHHALLESLPAAPRVVALGRRSGDRVGAVARAAFTARMLMQHAHVDWWLFHHMGIARTQLLLPPALRKPYGVILYGIEAWDSNMDGMRRAALRQARLRLAISRHTAARVADVHPEVGPVVPCLLALLPEVDLQPPATRTQREPTVLIVGRMSAAER